MVRTTPHIPHGYTSLSACLPGDGRATITSTRAEFTTACRLSRPHAPNSAPRYRRRRAGRTSPIRQADQNCPPQITTRRALGIWRTVALSTWIGCRIFVIRVAQPRALHRDGAWHCGGFRYSGGGIPVRGLTVLLVGVGCAAIVGARRHRAIPGAAATRWKGWPGSHATLAASRRVRVTGNSISMSTAACPTNPLPNSRLSCAATKSGRVQPRTGRCRSAAASSAAPDAAA